MTMPKQQGFTLIELIIVAAIIGILAAVVIPVYQDYVARSQAGEAVTLLSGVKSKVEEYIASQGQFPDDDQINITESGEYLKSIKLYPDTDTVTGYIQATFSDNNIASALSGATIKMKRNKRGEWKCTSDTIPADVLPSPCTSSE